MDPSTELGTLRGIQRLGVVIESLPAQLAPAELCQRLMRTQIEERLIREGIEVLAERDAIRQGLPYLYINVNVIRTGFGLYVFATRVSLKQTMVLAREPFVEFYTSTWETGGVGTVGVNNLPAMLGSIREHLNRFCEDHRAENSEGPSEGSGSRLAVPVDARERVSEWLKQLTHNFPLFQ